MSLSRKKEKFTLYINPSSRRSPPRADGVTASRVVSQTEMLMSNIMLSNTDLCNPALSHTATLTYVTYTLSCLHTPKCLSIYLAVAIEWMGHEYIKCFIIHFNLNMTEPITERIQLLQENYDIESKNVCIRNESNT